MKAVRPAAWVCLAALVGCRSAASPAAPSDAGTGVDVQILSIATWLGQLDPVAGATNDAGITAEYGGLAALSSYFHADRAKVPNTALFLVSDTFGASPPLSAQLQDVPAVKAAGFLGARVDMLSNHDFNHGIAYLQNLVGQSSYPYVASNLNDVQAQVNSEVAVPFTLVTVGPVKIGVVAVTDPNAPNKTLPGNFGSITISDPISGANEAATQARAAGAQAVVAMCDLETTTAGIAGAHAGPLVDLASGLVGVDVLFGAIAGDLGSTFAAPSAYLVGNVLVVEHVWKAETHGRTLLHFEGGALASATSTVVVSDANAIAPDPAAQAFLAPYRTQLAQSFDVPVSVVSSTLPLDGSERNQETALGDLVADAYLAKYAASGAQIAIMNGAGLRDALPSSYLPANKSLRRPTSGYAAGPPYDLVVGDAYSVLPFGDLCVVRPVTGAVLWRVLEQSVFQEPANNNGFLQIAGFKFTYQLSATAGTRVQSVTLDDGTSIARGDTTTYLLVDTNYLDTGGDSYGMLIQTPAATPRDLDADVLLDYLRANPQITPAVAGRITQVP